MRDASLERLTALAGLLVVALYLAASFALPAQPPGSEAPAAALGAYYAENHTWLLVALYLGALGAAVVPAFLAGLRDLLRRADTRGETTLATVGLVAGAVQFAVVAAGLGLLAAAVYRPGQGAESLRALTDAGWIVINLGSGPATAVSVAAFSIVLRRAGVMPAWVLAIGALAVVAHLVVAGAFAASGWLSPEGETSFVVPAFYYLWVLVVSLMLLRRRMPEAPT